MNERIITPKSRGFLFLDAHPAGCRRLVRDAYASVPARKPGRTDREGPVALIVGSSAGYGLAATIAGLARAGIRGIGVCLEKPPGRRTATAGWYRTTALDELAREHGHDMAFVNGDAFSDTVKEEVAALLRTRFGGRLDYLLYCVAAPRRTDPDTGVVHCSVLKPIGRPHHTKTLIFGQGNKPEVRSLTIPPASNDDIEQTIAVMGGADWTRWIDHLAERRLLAEGFTTAALSYLGPPLTERVYRQGTIGAAKAHLEATARALDTRLRTHLAGRALISVNGAAVTQASTAIPSIALYTALLRSVLGGTMTSPVSQLTQLWDLLTSSCPLPLDAHGRLRLDTFEINDTVQRELTRRWNAATTDNITHLADLEWFTTQIHQLYGFKAPHTDYTQPTITNTAWPSADGSSESSSVGLGRLPT